MNFKTFAIILISAGISFAMRAQLVVQWDKMQNWIGTGENRAAIGIQFNDGYALDTYVWGYRWSAEEAPSLRKVMTQIVGSDRSLCILEQKTDLHGKFTLAAIGYDEAQTDCHDIYFDFSAAKSDSKLNYNYYAPGGPGNDTPALCAAAIAAAKINNVVLHPINADSFSWPAYDYDHWHMPGLSPERHWNAGWNIGNWVVWKGEAGNDTYSYTGLAYSSAKVENGDVIVWNFNRHSSYPFETDPVDGYTGASRPMRPAKYTTAAVSGTKSPRSAISRVVIAIFDIRGRLCRWPLRPGIYIVKYSDNTSNKLIIK